MGQSAISASRLTLICVPDAVTAWHASAWSLQPDHETCLLGIAVQESSQLSLALTSKSSRFLIIALHRSLTRPPHHTQLFNGCRCRAREIVLRSGSHECLLRGGPPGAWSRGGCRLRQHATPCSDDNDEPANPPTRSNTGRTESPICIQTAPNSLPASLIKSPPSPAQQ